jgi:glycosyltransferase involved in cell wall biosynthesis
VIELYAISDHPCPPLPGNAADLEVVAAGSLAAVCAPPSPHDSVESLWRHEEVVELLMRDRDLLPIRLGTVMADRHTVMDALSARHAELVRALDCVRGAVEVSVRAIEPAAPAGRDEPQPSSDGASYLRTRSLARGAPRGDARTVHRALVRIARQAVVRRAPDAREVLRAAYLVDRRRLPDFTEALQRIARELPFLELLCTGPWPPYSFTDP